MPERCLWSCAELVTTNQSECVGSGILCDEAQDDTTELHTQYI